MTSHIPPDGKGKNEKSGLPRATPAQAGKSQETAAKVHGVKPKSAKSCQLAPEHAFEKDSP